jgi:Zn-dependent M28 family amino/carboxypeptidase
MNLDMVGRNRAGEEKYNETVFFLANGKRKRMYKRMVKRNGKLNENLDISFHPGLDKRLIWTFSSDHFRFKRRNIPFITLFTGLHPDYHTSRDTPDKINYPKLTEITRVGVETLWQIANSDKNIQSRLKTPTTKNLIERLMD